MDGIIEEDNPIIIEFLTEVYESLDQLDQDLVDLEAHPKKKSLLDNIFRAVHTIKGTCGFLGFSKLESISHVSENLLSKMRDGELEMSQDIANALLMMVDAIRQILSCIESDRNEGDVDYAEFVELMTSLQSGENLPAEKKKTSPSSSSKATRKSEDLEPETLLEKLGGQKILKNMVANIFKDILADDRLNHFFKNVDMSSSRLQTTEFFRDLFEGRTHYEGRELQELYGKWRANGMNEAHFDAFMIHCLVAVKGLNVAEDLIQKISDLFQPYKREFTQRTPAGPDQATPERSSGTEAKAWDGIDRRSGKAASEEIFLDDNPGRRSEDHTLHESIRVDVDLLDRLMNLVGELVLARNQIMQYAGPGQGAAFNATTQHLNQLTAELQESVMKTRMQPIGNIWNRFPRVVRDLSLACGKQVRLEMEGKETELDKTLIEAIKDPLTHMVRNSVDHGIESPDVRRASNKPAEGVLRLRAYHEGGQVNIEIADDGGGIDPEKVRQKALSKSLITSQEAAEMTDRELVQLVFRPGFSTAARVSNLSGRGVGMDVVKTNIEKIGGTVGIQSQVNVGTTLNIKIPLTLAIVPALVVQCSGNRYAIPQVNLVELVRLEAGTEALGVESIQGCPVYRLRGNLLPLIFLHEELGLSPAEDALEEAVNIVVLNANNRQFGLVVDGISDTQEIVVKPLGKQLKGIRAYAGATIMGDGKVVLILDVMGLAQKAHVVSEENCQASRVKDEAMASQQKDVQTLLVFSDGLAERMAVPLSMVARLEEFRRDIVERSGEQDVVQYRDEIMPLVYLWEFFGHPEPAPSETMQVIVCTEKGRSVGVVVDHIIDIVEEAITIKKGMRGKDLFGTAVIQGKITDLLDFKNVIHEADPHFDKGAVVTK